jgi:hypothetical protein
MLDPYGPVLGAHPAVEPIELKNNVLNENVPDEIKVPDEENVLNEEKIPDEASIPNEAVEPPPRKPTAQNFVTRVDAAHQEATPSPHFNVQAAIQDQNRRKGSLSSSAGQILAYLGILGLTVGTSFVLLGHFAGPAHLAPTGWLITTAGQMLLFLGVVTLVSGGMEQTTAEVARRIDSLNEKIVRIEQASINHALRGPSVRRESFAKANLPEQDDDPQVRENVRAANQRG